MSLKDDEKEIDNIKQKVHELQEHSFAYELLKDQKNLSEKQNKKQFIIILVILGMWFATIGYLVYILTDISTETTTTENYDMDTENGNNNFIGGDNNGNIENN